MRKFVITLLLAYVALPSSAQEAVQMLGMNQQQTSQTVRIPAAQAAYSDYTVGISYEPGFITSKVNDGYDDVTWRGGRGFAIDFWQLREGKGFGVNLSHSSTDYSFPGTDKPLKLYYVGLAYVRAGALGRRWVASWSIGMGYAHYVIDKHYQYYISKNWSSGGFGFMLRGGIEYLPKERVGIALDIRETAHIFPGEDSGGKGLIPGFERLGFNLGLRYHF